MPSIDLSDAKALMKGSLMQPSKDQHGRFLKFYSGEGRRAFVEFVDYLGTQREVYLRDVVKDPRMQRIMVELGYDEDDMRKGMIQNVEDFAHWYRQFKIDQDRAKRQHTSHVRRYSRFVNSLDMDLAIENGVDPVEISELREIFELVDDDKGGSIDCDELGKLLTILGMNLSHAEVDLLIEMIDTSGEKEISFSDFATYLLRSKQVPYTPEAVIAAFEKLRPRYDPSPTKKHISQEAVMWALTHHGADKLSLHSARALLDKCQVFNSITARIDFNEYVRVMMFRTTSSSSAGSAMDIGSGDNFLGGSFG